MPEVIDIMQTNFAVSPTFTVDLLVDSVPLEPAAGGPHSLRGGSGQGNFVSGDNLIILSAGYVLPEGFTMAEYDNTEVVYGLVSPSIFLLVTDVVTLATSQCWQFGTGGVFRFPMHNYEVSIGTFINPRILDRPGPILNAFSLQCEFPYIPTLAVDRPNVSMMNVPAALDGKTFHVPVFLKVLHNIELL